MYICILYILCMNIYYIEYIIYIIYSDCKINLCELHKSLVTPLLSVENKT